MSVRRLLASITITAGALLGMTGVATAHPPETNPGQAQGFDTDPVFKSAFGHANAQGLNNGILPGFVVHSPACSEHVD